MGITFKVGEKKTCISAPYLDETIFSPRNDQLTRVIEDSIVNGAIFFIHLSMEGMTPQRLKISVVFDESMGLIRCCMNSVQDISKGLEVELRA